MGLDFTVSEVTKQYVNELGGNVFITTELANFGHTGYKCMDYGLGRQENCTTVSYESVKFLEVLDEMRKDLDEINKSGKDEYKEKADLEDAIDELQSFIEKEHITEDSDRVFDIHIWY